MDVREYTETFPERAARRAAGRVPRVGLDRARVRQRVHVLHRAARPRSAALALDRRHPGGGAGARRARRRRGHAARSERQHVRARPDRAGSSQPPAVRASCCGGWARSTGIRRVRFTRPHPHDFTPDVIEAMAETPSGLRAHPLPAAIGVGPRARRRCGAPTAASATSDGSSGSASRVPDVAVSTDVIVGFPGETEEDFAETLDARGASAVRQRVHVPVLAAAGDRAATMDEQVPKAVVQERFDRLVERSRSAISLERIARAGRRDVRGAGRGRGQARAAHAGADADQPHRAPGRGARAGDVRQTHDHRRRRAPPGRRARARAGGRAPSEVGRP